MAGQLLIGSNGSQHFTPLLYARSDAERVAKALEKHGGFDTEVVATSNAGALRERLLRFYSETADCEAAVIYFAGHGEPRKGELFLVLDHTDPSDFLSSALTCSDITRGLKFSEAKNKLLILDCCSAGSGAKGARGRIAEIVPDSESFMIFAASEALEPTREHERWCGSFLSDLLVQTLGEFQRLTLGQLNKIARSKAKQHQADYPDERLSTPFMYGSESGSFTLTYRARNGFAIVFDDHLENNLQNVIAQVRQSKLAPIALATTSIWRIEWPSVFDQRFEELARFKTEGEFPTRDRVDAEPLVNMVDQLVERRAHLEGFVTRALRQCIPRIIDGDAASDWLLALDSALRSAVFLLGRSLYACRFDAESAEPWHEPFLHTEIDWGSGVIGGLAPVWSTLDHDKPVLFWKDAYYVADSGKKRRVFLPISEAVEVDRNILYSAIAPQLIWDDVGFEDLEQIERDGELLQRFGFIKNVIYRSETFIDGRYFRHPDGNSGRRKQVERTIIDYFVEKGIVDMDGLIELSRGLSFDTIFNSLKDKSVTIKRDAQSPL